MSVDNQRMHYYCNLFPFEDCCRWLGYGSGYILPLRELTFGTDKKSFLRYLSFHNAQDFKLNVMRVCPQRIDIGPVYSVSPVLASCDQNRKLIRYNIIQKEIAFDIDISDYDEVRICCKGANICQKCWKYMSIACKILNTALREDFGFRNILWTYSGGRGIHCWVCDEKARNLKSKERAAIANYLQVVKGGGYNKKKVYFNNNPHPSIQRALRIIEPLFVKIVVEEQNTFGTEEGIEAFFGIISSICDSKTIKEELMPIIQEFETSLDRWEALKDFLKKMCVWKNSFIIEELVLQYMYPRMDVNVTTILNHLLKCPYSPHDRTLKICIPFDPAKVDDFDPTTSPDMSLLFEESQRKKAETSELKNLQKFNESLVIFKNFIDNLPTYKFGS